MLADGDGQAVISEVMWMGSDLSTADEWVEIACLGTSDCNLSGWTFTSLKSTGEEAVVISFLTGAVIPAGDVRVLSHYAAAASRLLSEPWITTSSMSLPNSKLLLRLRDAAGSVRDEVDDGIGNPFAGGNPSGGPKASMERIDLNAPGNVLENWRTASVSSGFKEGLPIFGTPGELSLDRGREGSLSSSSSDSSASSLSSDSFFSSQTSLTSSTSSSSNSGSSLSSESSSSLDYARDDTAVSSASLISSASSAFSASSASSLSVFITEVLANPIGADTDEWIEIGNLGAEPVDIAGWILDDGNSSAIYHILPRSGSGFLLAPGEHWSFRKSVTALPLDNSGERVSLMNGSQLIDAWEYAQTAEEVSFGRDPDPPYSLHAFCVPSEGKRNVSGPLAPRIIIQDAGSASVGSAYVQGTEHVTLNLQAQVGAGSLASAVCAWDFGDDAVSGACNPPSHTFSDAGDFSVRLTVRDFCGGISVASLSVSVLPEEEAAVRSSASSASSASSVSSHSRSSASSSSSSVVLMSMQEDVSIETGVILSEVYSVPCHGELCRTMTACDRVSPFDSAQGDTCGNLEILQEEWIELHNPTDHEISLSGWILDDLKDGGSKPWKIPSDSRIGAGEYRIFPGGLTKLQLNDAGDDVWFMAPDESWSDHISIPKLKAGISFSFCDGEPARRSLGEAKAKPDEVGWRASHSTPGLPNDCQAVTHSSASSIVSAKKPQAKGGQTFLKKRYVIVSSDSSASSASSDSFISSGSFVMSYAESELPASLTVTGETAEKSPVPEVSVLGAFSGLGIALIWFGRKWWWL